MTTNEAAVLVERLVIGADFGADGYTTREQADELARRLRLRPGLRLLELGTGNGWPGVYLTKTTGCQTVLTDVPVEGLRVATARASREGIAERCAVVAADGDRLPFAIGSFDAVAHTPTCSAASGPSSPCWPSAAASSGPAGRWPSTPTTSLPGLLPATADGPSGADHRPSPPAATTTGC